MKVTELSVENFKRITSVAVRLKPHVTEISGPNGAGKSSYIDALWVLLKGKKVAPAEPIRKGAERCRIRGRIGEYMVTRIFKRTRTDEVTTELRIERDNESMPPTENFMRTLIGDHMLDPGDFINLSSDAKFDVFRSFVPGVDFKVITNQNRQDYERRTDVNRMARESRAAAHMINVPEGTPDTAIDKGALVQQLQEAGDGNAAIERRRANREKVVDQITQLKALHASADERFNVFATERQATCDARVDELLAQMEQLKAAIEATQKTAREEALKRSAEIAVEAVNALDQANELQAKLDAAGPLPQPIDTQALAETIRQAEFANEAILKLQTRDKHVKVAERYEGEAAEITARMDAREKVKQDAIAAAQLPVAGITFGDGEVFLDGVPFDQASTAQKFRVGVAIAVAKNPTLRLVWVRDASLLDDHSYELISKLAAEFDCQILLETVRAIGKDAIVLEDGHIKEAAAAEAVPA
jgi:predicted ATP-dependent endonuclease of OLD family